MTTVDPIYGMIERAEQALDEAIALPEGSHAESMDRNRKAIEAHGKLEEASRYLKERQSEWAPDVYEGLRQRLLVSAKKLMIDIFKIDESTVAEGIDQ